MAQSRRDANVGRGKGGEQGILHYMRLTLSGCERPLGRPNFAAYRLVFPNAGIKVRAPDPRQRL